MNINLIDRASAKAKRALKGWFPYIFGKLPIDLIITHCEVNERHGTGVLIKRIFSSQDCIASFRCHDLYAGEESFSAYHSSLIDFRGENTAEAVAYVSKVLKGKRPRRILCIPYFASDASLAIVLKKYFDIPLCTYIMDDQNINKNGDNHISDDILNALFSASHICFGVSNNLCKAYTDKFQHKFWFLPPVAPASLIRKEPAAAHEFSTNLKKGIIIGNMWSQEWLNRLREMIKITGITVDWYAKQNREWIVFDDDELSRDGIHYKGFCPEEQLVPLLKQVSFALVPTAQSDRPSDRVDIARLSLPSRIPFIVATTHTPLIVVGSHETAAADFVNDYQLGTVCDYDTKSFENAVNWIVDLQNQNDIRQRAARLSPTLSSEGVSQWIWQSLERKHPVDYRFENLEQTCATKYKAVITLNEVTQKHGTGALVKRIIADTPNIFSIRSCNHYDADHHLGEERVCLSQENPSRIQAFQNVIRVAQDYQFENAFCVPYWPNELLTSIAIKELFNVPLGTYIMDDQNIITKHIADDLMREFLNKCTIRFTTHPEMREAYEKKFGLDFWLLPAVVPGSLISDKPNAPHDELLTKRRGALIGSIWSERWYASICQILVDTGISIDWYGHPEYWWMKDSVGDMKEKNLYAHGVLPEAELAEKLRQYPFVVVPYGTLDENDDRRELSQLSLPGRIIFALAATNTPVILIGSQETSAARFIKRFGNGVICPYDAASFRQAVESVSDPVNQLAFRKKAASIAHDFSDNGVTDWLWQSFARGQPQDLRFENLFTD